MLVPTDKVTVEAVTSTNAYGDPTYGSPRTLMARIRSNNEEIRTLQGEVVTSQSVVTFPGDPGIGYDDRLTLPDGSQLPIVGIRKPKDLHGAVHHTDVLL